MFDRNETKAPLFCLPCEQICILVLNLISARLFAAHISILNPHNRGRFFIAVDPIKNQHNGGAEIGFALQPFNFNSVSSANLRYVILLFGVQRR